MLADAEKSYSETFIIWNDAINLVAALIPSNKGRAAACGTIKFKNGEKLFFSSQPDDCAISHERLIFVCRCIAKFYGTNVIRRKYRITDSVNESSVLLRKEHHLLN
jgi:hypothetical protein